MSHAIFASSDKHNILVIIALGKTGPVEWFSISESGALLMGAAVRAAGL